MNVKVVATTVTLGLAALAAGLAWGESPDRFVEYVEATGLQYVDLGVVGRVNTRADMDLMWTEFDHDYGYLSARKGDSRFNFMWVDWRHNPQPGYGEWHNVGGFTFTAYRRYRIVADFQSDIRTLKENGTNIWVDASTQYGSVDTGLNLFLFAGNFDGTPKYFSKARCYGLRLWQDGVPVRDLKPCVKDGRGGLYDEVTQTILYAQGGDLAYSCVPDSFVEYIESTGTQYVDTKVVGRDGLRARIDMCWPKAPVTDECFLGCRTNRNTDSRFNLLSTDQKRQLYPGYGTYGWTGPVVEAGRRCVYDVNFTTNSRTIFQDGVQVYNDAKPKDPFDTRHNLYLFAQNLGGSAALFAKTRCYGVRIWNGETLVRDFLPGVVGGRGVLYDRVSGRLFLPQGAPVTVFGKEVRPKSYLEYVETDGRQHVDTEVPAKTGVKSDLRASVREMSHDALLSSTDMSLLGACDPRNKGLDFVMTHLTCDKTWSACGNGMGYNGSTAIPEKEVRSLYTYDGQGQRISFADDQVVGFGAEFGPTGQVLTIDGVVRGMRTFDPTETFDTEFTLYLFACNKEGNVQAAAAAECHLLDLWTNGVPVRKFRPCVIAGADGDAADGLYDKVEGKIYEFDKAPYAGTPAVVYELEPGKTSLAHPFVSPGGKYIDTGVIGRTGVKAHAVGRIASPNNGKENAFLSARNQTKDVHFIMIHSDNAGVWQKYGKTTLRLRKAEQTNMKFVDGMTFDMTVDYAAARQTVDLDGFRLYSRPDVDAGGSLYLFATHDVFSERALYRAKARFYRLKLSQGGVPVRDLRPVRTSTDETMLYDVIGDRLYPSAGAAFSAQGPDAGAVRGSFLIFR